MRDAFVIEGQIISHKGEDWEIGKIYLVPGNHQLYVQLKSSRASMNVQLRDIIDELTSYDRIKQVVSNIL